MPPEGRSCTGRVADAYKAQREGGFDQMAPHWGEIRQLMSAATAEEQELSSDEDGAVDSLMQGCTASWGRSRSAATTDRNVSAPERGGTVFSDRLSAAFDGYQHSLWRESEHSGNGLHCRLWQDLSWLARDSMVHSACVELDRI